MIGDEMKKVSFDSIKWAESEMPDMAGTPALLAHSPGKKALYFITSLILGISGGLCVQILSAFLPEMRGYFHLTPEEISFLTSSYMAAYGTANVIIFKLRQQFGANFFIKIGVIIYTVSIFFQFLLDNYPVIVLVNIVSGVSAAVTSTACVLYMMQVFSVKNIGRAFILSMGILQLPQYIIWILGGNLISYGEIKNIYLFILAFSLLSCALVFLVQLPHSWEEKVLEKTDILSYITIALFFFFIALFLNAGVINWWVNSTEVAYYAITCIFLLFIIITIEYNRKNPVIKMDLILLPETLILIIGAIMLRFMNISEQSYAFVGIMRSYGFNADQFKVVFSFGFLGAIIGILVASFWVKLEQKLLLSLILLSFLFFAVANYMGSQMTSLSRPVDFILPQFLVGIGAGIFLGPTIILAALVALKKGINYIMIMCIVLSLTQYYGGVIASSAMGSFNYIKSEQAKSAINSNIKLNSPQVITKMQQEFNCPVNDSLNCYSDSLKKLHEIANRESKVIAYNSVFYFNFILILIYCLFSYLFLFIFNKNKGLI